MTGQVLHCKSYDNNPYPRWITPIFTVLFIAFLYYALSKKIEPALILLVPVVVLGWKLYRYVRYPEEGDTASKPMEFSDTRLVFGDQVFEIKNIVVIAAYLNSYDGFKFHIGQNSQGTEDGNGSQISIRTRDNMIHDYNFYLSDFEKFSLMRKLLVVWEAAGVAVALEQAYSDEYMLEQMSRYGS